MRNCYLLKFNLISIFLLMGRLQISHLGIQFDYKKERQNAWIYSTIPIAANVLFILLSSYIYRAALANSSTLGLIHFFVSYIIKNAISILASISFITLACNLRQRFAALNLLLRSQFQFTDELFAMARTHHSHSLLNLNFRNHFMNGNILKLAIGVRKRDSIDTIKFVGRQHSCLTGIMNDMNFCYSFQVTAFVRGNINISMCDCNHFNSI